MKDTGNIIEEIRQRKVSDSFKSILIKAGFKDVPWDRCPQGFQKANYPCYSNEEKNIWCEVYAGDRVPYCWLIGPNTNPRGIFFNEPKELRSFIKSNKQSKP